MSEPPPPDLGDPRAGERIVLLLDEPPERRQVQILADGRYLVSAAQLGLHVLPGETKTAGFSIDELCALGDDESLPDEVWGRARRLAGDLTAAVRLVFRLAEPMTANVPENRLLNR